MGYWVDTAFVAHPSVDAVDAAMRATFAAEGMIETPAPAPRKRKLVEPMQYESALRNDLWAVALIPGAPGWVALKTAPLQLMVESAAGAAVPRLAALCMTLGVGGFQIAVQDGGDLMLAEFAADGAMRTSGVDLLNARDPLSWHALRIEEADYRPSFGLLPLGSLIEGAERGEAKALAIAKALGGVNADLCDNETSVSTLIEARPLAAADARARYFRWSGACRQRFEACDSWQDYRARIADVQSRPNHSSE